jgi:hypothetical protein
MPSIGDPRPVVLGLRRLNKDAFPSLKLAAENIYVVLPLPFFAAKGKSFGGV